MVCGIIIFVMAFALVMMFFKLCRKDDTIDELKEKLSILKAELCVHSKQIEQLRHKVSVYQKELVSITQAPKNTTKTNLSSEEKDYFQPD